MRVEPFTVESYVHVVKRGARGLPIVLNKADSYRFLRLLYYMNDEFLDENWDHKSSLTPLTTSDGQMFARLSSWPERKPLVTILAYTLLPNHFHLLLKEIVEGGISRFMQKLSQSMTNHHNEKYHQKGSIFQGSYHGRTIDSDEYFRYVAVYILVKNTFELYPHGGLIGALEDFDRAWDWALGYAFSNLGDFVRGTKSPIVEYDLLNDVFAGPADFKKFSKDVLLGRMAV